MVGEGIKAAGKRLGGFPETRVDPASACRIEKHTGSVGLVPEPVSAPVRDHHRCGIHSVGRGPILIQDPLSVRRIQRDQQTSAAALRAAVAAPVLPGRGFEHGEFHSGGELWRRIREHQSRKSFNLESAVQTTDRHRFTQIGNPDGSLARFNVLHRALNSCLSPFRTSGSVFICVHLWFNKEPAAACFRGLIPGRGDAVFGP